MTDKRLIEYYIPIKAISAEASREKSIRQGHISTLHLWWARRPLVASRAAVFAALVAADAQPQIIDVETKAPMTLTRFMVELCKWQVSSEILDEARRLIREAYPDHPPKVLDMFAGGGSIPLEALRLGCEAYALDLNPVAHIIELATLVYPQQYGPKLADDVRKWGEWVLERVRAEVGDLYPLIPDPAYSGEKAKLATQHGMFDEAEKEAVEPEPSKNALEGPSDDDTLPDDLEEESDASTGLLGAIPKGYLQPVAYLWTRTVTCPNPSCRASVPLVRQTWLKKKKGDNVALAMMPHPAENRMAFHVRQAADPNDFGFDPAGFSTRGNSLCGRCGTTVTSDYVKTEGKAGRMGAQMMATVCVRPGARGKVYLSPDDVSLPLPDEAAILARIAKLTQETGITVPDEPLPEKLTGGMCTLYGLVRFGDLFTPRQMLTLLTFVKQVRAAYAVMIEAGVEAEYAKAVITYLALALDKMADRNSSLCRWDLSFSGLASTFARQALPMVWDYVEANPIAEGAGSLRLSVGDICGIIANIPNGIPAQVQRGSAAEEQFESDYFTAVITDPPYYDNVSYADLSDYFYVWLKRSIGWLYEAHFSGEITPKKKEAIAAPYRHGDDKDASRQFYETMMSRSLDEANRVLKADGIITIVYAHKTTAGWSTLIDALRMAGFSIVEAWPLDTEMPGRSIAMDTAALASSIFLVARKRSAPVARFDYSRFDSGHVYGEVGHYASDVLPEMQRIVRERVKFFLEAGVTGADLNIATVGAGLAPFTRYARVELPNGEELSAARYLDEVQSEVVRVLLGEAASADAPTQYYIMARSYYGAAWVDFDEGNTLARATGIELDTGPSALTKGKAALVEKKGAKVRLRDYTERGDDESLGLPTPERAKAPLIDVMHRLLWLAENDNSKLSEFLLNAQPERYLLRVVAQSLGGRALAAEPTPGAVRDERTPEQRAIDTLLASWRRIFEEGTLL